MAKGIFSKIKNSLSKKATSEDLTNDELEAVLDESSVDNPDSADESSDINFTMTDTVPDSDLDYSNDIPTIDSDYEEDISDLTSDQYEEDISDLTSDGYEEDISDLTSDEYEEDISDLTSDGYEEDISDLTSDGYEEDISDLTSDEYEEDISDLTSDESENTGSDDDANNGETNTELAAIEEDNPSSKKRKKKKDKEPGEGKNIKSLFKVSANLFSIRNKIFICFLVPVLFMILVGTLAYQRAVKGMSDKFNDTTLQTLKMTTAYIDTISLQIETEASSYANDDQLNKWFLGMITDNFEIADLTKKTKTNITTSQKLNPYINNIHVIPSEDLDILTTKALSNTSSAPKGIFDEYKEDVGMTGKLVSVWGDSHQKLDELLSLKQEEYILCLQVLAKKRMAVIVVDVNKDKLQEFLQGFDFGKGSIFGLVTANGREVVYENVGEEGGEGKLAEGEIVFADKDFYQEALANMEEEDAETFGSSQVKYNGSKYLFLYSGCGKTGATVCALIPMKIITGQAESIKNLTIWLVIIATAIASVIGVLIASGIQKNMHKITRGLGEVANGDLTVEIRSTGKDEFNGLANSATYMIKNNKKLVSKVNNATLQLENSANEVKSASEIITDYSSDISKAIGGINEGMARQSSHAQVCVDHTNVLSNEIKEVSRVVSKVEDLVSETEAMIEEGLSMVQLLGERANETTEITSTVGHNIEALQVESTSINKFVAIITEISDQTNLLSINASIEAAKAGEAGHGFAVVADEIRKLADDSAKAAGEISINVSNISSQTESSVNSARQAEQMVARQAEVVSDVIEVFREMSVRMSGLVAGLKEIVTSMEKADSIRHETIGSVRNISGIINETATNAAKVNGVIEQLLSSVDNLNNVSVVLDENMDELKSEISVFKTE